MPFILCFLLFSAPLHAIDSIQHFDSNGYTYLEVPRGMGDHFLRICEENGVPLRYAYKLIDSESKWRIRAVNRNTDGSRDLGIMQLNSNYIDEFAWRYNNGVPFDPFDWKTSMAVGIKHLATLYKHTGTWYGAIIAYNIGLNAYRQHELGLRKLPSSTKLYVAYILNLNS